MAAQMRAHDWNKAGLGPPQDWPQSLKTVVRILLTSRCATWMAWGLRLTFEGPDCHARTSAYARRIKIWGAPGRSGAPHSFSAGSWENVRVSLFSCYLVVSLVALVYSADRITPRPQLFFFRLATGSPFAMRRAYPPSCDLGVACMKQATAWLRHIH